MKQEVDYFPPEEIMAAVERAKAGDVDAFWRLVEPYQQSLYITAYSLLRNAGDAEEVVQETMLKALKHLDQLKDVQCFKSWLMKIAANEARMIQRKGMKEVPLEDDAEWNAKIFSLRDYADWRDVPSNALEQKEVWDAVHRALESLSPACREVFVLRDIQHFTVPEVADILAISEDKVSVRLHRARLQMRDLLAPLFREPLSPWVPMKMMADMSAIMIHKVVSCKTVLREISSYIEGEVNPDLRLRIEAHLKYCRRCKLVLDTTRKVIYLVADDKVLIPPFALTGRRFPH
ncbi:MAG: sigma-70 family RNA polymerase sigma factor [Acidobacteriota bacterium]